jgi:hypothetical protein
MRSRGRFADAETALDRRGELLGTGPVNKYGICSGAGTVGNGPGCVKTLRLK